MPFRPAKPKPESKAMIAYRREHLRYQKVSELRDLCADDLQRAWSKLTTKERETCIMHREASAR